MLVDVLQLQPGGLAPNTPSHKSSDGGKGAGIVARRASVLGRTNQQCDVFDRVEWNG